MNSTTNKLGKNIYQSVQAMLPLSQTSRIKHRNFLIGTFWILITQAVTNALEEPAASISRVDVRG
jgi:phage baseplate assembly protein W